MGASPELLSAAENVPPALLAGEVPQVEAPCVEFEEFPADLPVGYDWILQPASQRTSRRALHFFAVTVAVLLIGISILLVRTLSRPSSSVLASPPSSQH